jgi:hypothetical protein
MEMMPGGGGGVGGRHRMKERCTSSSRRHGVCHGCRRRQVDTHPLMFYIRLLIFLLYLSGSQLTVFIRNVCPGMSLQRTSRSRKMNHSDIFIEY